MRRIVLGDALVASVAGAVGFHVRFTQGPGPLSYPAASYWLAVALPVAWVLAMWMARSYETRFLWVGSEEFRRIFTAAVFFLAAIGTVSWALRLEVARGFVILALPLATVLTLAQRYGHRALLHRARRRGDHQATTIIVGHRAGVSALSRQIARDPSHGYRVVGCCLPTHQEGETFEGLPVLGGMDDVVDVVERYQVDTVAVLPSPEIDGPALRALGWSLEKTKAELLLAPAVTEVAGPRVRIRPVCGLPLMHVERPEFRGVRRIVKDVFDRSVAAAAILVLLPVFAALAVAVKVSSPGPVFFRHERVGRAGLPFHVLKFRSMVHGADRELAALIKSSDGNAVQFKMKRDPRVTRVGAVMRRYSLDELPQLFNVVAGTMSLVGPRPHVTREVEQYGVDMRRRLLVKPGITGLWQVSGRSDLSWDDAVRMDVRYVENWTLTFDLMILAKTFRAVLRGSGAY